MANGDLVQQAVAGGTGSTVTVTLGATPTVGNTLIASVVGNSSTVVAKVTGFLPCEFTVNVNLNVGLYYRQVVAGDTTSVVVTPGAAGFTAMHVEEVVGVWKPHRSVVGPTDNSTVTSRSSGTTAATTTAVALCCAAMGIQNVTSTAHSWSNSYTLRTLATISGGAGRTLVRGDLVVSSTGTQTSTLTWTTALKSSGLIGVFVLGAEADGTYITAVKADSPYSLYRLNRDAIGVIPDEMNHVHLRAMGGITSLATGPVAVEPQNYAKTLDGSTGWADSKTTDTADSDTLTSYTGDATLEAWVKTSTIPQGVAFTAPVCVFTSHKADSHGTFAFPMMFGGTDWWLHYRDSAVIGQSMDTSSAIPTDTWEIWWLQLSAAGGKVYHMVAGVVTQAGTTQTGITQGDFNMHRIGRSQVATGGWAGTVANLAVYHSALTTTQMQSHYDAAFPPSGADTDFSGSIPI